MSRLRPAPTPAQRQPLTSEVSVVAAWQVARTDEIYVVHEAMNDVFLAYIDGTRGEEGAVRRLQSARARARSLADRETAAQGAWLLGRLHIEKGDDETARLHLADARSEADALAADNLLQDIGRDLERLAMDAGA